MRAVFRVFWEVCLSTTSRWAQTVLSCSIITEYKATTPEYLRVLENVSLPSGKHIVRPRLISLSSAGAISDSLTTRNCKDISFLFENILTVIFLSHFKK